MDPFEALDPFYPEIIEQMPKRFSSHEFILKLAHQHQGLYIRALAQYADSDRPFGIVHGLLAKRLFQKYAHLVRYVGDEPSHDIFGHSNSAAVWTKIT